MQKLRHEIRDPVHMFIKLDSDERKVVDSRPFQRLRYIHQLGMTYLLYPGATHRRFEHSLGVMELASRIFDVATNTQNLRDEIRGLLPDANDPVKRSYWRRALRMGALCHDLGHLPFSHAAEKELLPNGWGHERIARTIILSDEMRGIWRNMVPPVQPEHVAKLALGKEGTRDLEFTDWEAVLSEIIVSDFFGADRIDYLLRDSLYAGVAYGRFDHYRLIDTIRILSSPYQDKEPEDVSIEPTLGVEEGGIHSSEALLLARYFMFKQVYCHPIRRAYDIHLRDFLKDWLGGIAYPTELERFLRITDDEVMKAVREASNDKSKPGHTQAKRIVERDHFKLLWRSSPEDNKKNPEAASCVFDAIKKEFGADVVSQDDYVKESGIIDFPVLTVDDTIMSSLELSALLGSLPDVRIGNVFVDSKILDDAKSFLDTNKDDIIAVRGEK